MSPKINPKIENSDFAKIQMQVHQRQIIEILQTVKEGHLLLELNQFINLLGHIINQQKGKNMDIENRIISFVFQQKEMTISKVMIQQSKI
ncbi:unnamed protein product [Paramecium octaurelia]|uniref:Uncharacterized protein n=1 Tax=Paramecium octaurelia TaxID=43137 RepID=A0A8S1TRZ6_PAROT|nr:unnamed protein product [Paramecium octaurelia]